MDAYIFRIKSCKCANIIISYFSPPLSDETLTLKPPKSIPCTNRIIDKTLLKYTTGMNEIQGGMLF